MSLSSGIDSAYEVLEFFNLIKKFLPKCFICLQDLLLDITLVTLNCFVNLFHMLDRPLVILLCLLVQFLMGKVDLVEELSFRFSQLGADLADKFLASAKHVLVVIDHLTVLHDRLTVGAKAHLGLQHRLFILALELRKFFLKLGNAVGCFVVHR